MSQSEVNGEGKLDRIDDVVRDCLVRRAAGDEVSNESIISEHPELMPELLEWLHCLQVIEELDGSKDPITRTSKHRQQHCPQCDKLVEFRCDSANVDDCCSSCGTRLDDTSEMSRDVATDCASNQFTMRTRCPHCHSAIQLDSDAELSDIECHSCGSSFSLLGNETTGHETGRRIAQFELIERIGAGAFGSVWRALDTTLDRTVAVKIPRKDLLDSNEAEQFLREARSSAQLRHTNIVTVHEVGRENGQVYIVSDYVAGRTLAELLDDEQLPCREAAKLCAKLAAALEHAHGAGVIHRDVKPSNIIVDQDGEPHIMDFGLAKREIGEVTMTMDGKVLGTPTYMSPEQALGDAHHADARSDVYSLGVVLFELLTGHRPFRGNVRILLQQVVNDDPPSPSKLNSNVPLDLETICLMCLEKSPVRRYQTALDLADDLKRWLRNEPIAARPIGHFERSLRWCQRRPLVATLMATVMFVTAFGFGGVSWQWKKATQAQRKSYRDAYSADMLHAQRALTDKNLGLAVLLLDKYSPQQGQPDVRGFEWRLLWQQTRGNDLSVFGKHDYNVLGLAISPDGRHLASVSGWGCGDVKVWDLKASQKGGKGKLLAQPEIGGAVGTVAFSPNSQTLAYGMQDGMVTAWDVVKQKVVSRAPGIHSERLGALTFLPNGHLAVGDVDGTVRIWELAAGDATLVAESDRHDAFLTSMAVSPDGAVLATGHRAADQAGRIRFWNLRGIAEERVAEARGPVELPVAIQAVSFSPNGKHLVCGHRRNRDSTNSNSRWDGLGSTLTVLELQTIDKQPHHNIPLKGHHDAVMDLAFSPDGQLLTSASFDHTIGIWNSSTWQRRNVLGGHLHEVSSIVFSLDDDRILYSGGKDGTIRTWDPDRTKTATSKLIPFRGDEKWDDKIDRELTISWDGSAFCTARNSAKDHDKQSVLTLWDVGTGKEVNQAHIPPLQRPGSIPMGGHLPLAVSRHGHMVATVLFDETVCLWNVAGRWQRIIDSPLATRVASVEFTRDGHTLFILRENGQLERVPLNGAHLESARATSVVPPQDGVPHSLSFSENGQRIAIGKADGTISAWKFSNETLLQERVWQPHFETVDSVVYFPDGETVATSSRDGSLAFWHLASGRRLKDVYPERNAFFCLTISQDGKRLAAGTATGEIKLWDVESRQEVMERKVTDFSIYRLAFADENTLVCVAARTGVKIFKAPSWEQIEAEEAAGTLTDLAL